MKWVKFSERNPEEGIRLITRILGYGKLGSGFEDWRCWNKEILFYKPSPTHWWDGPFDFDLAVRTWKENADNRKRTTIQSSTAKTI